MVCRFICLFLFFAMGPSGFSQQKKVEDEASMTIVSQLGRGFGKIVTVEGRMKYENAGGKGDKNRVVMAVQKVDGAPINSVVMDLFPYSVVLREQIEAAIAAGTSVRIAAFENLRPVGIPMGLGKYMTAPASTSWHVQHELVLCSFIKQE
jgi:hypothetical protein